MEEFAAEKRGEAILRQCRCRGQTRISKVSARRVRHGFPTLPSSWRAKTSIKELHGTRGPLSLLAVTRRRSTPQDTAFESRSCPRKYLQFEFSRQWQTLRGTPTNCGIRVVGDLPIYVALDSADVWANRQYFHLTAHGRTVKSVRRSTGLFQRDRANVGQPNLRLGAN